MKRIVMLAVLLCGVSMGFAQSSPLSGREALYIENAYGIDMKFVWVEGGTFSMGCTIEQGGNCEPDETNVRNVTVDGYYIGQFEVTQEQWEKVMGTTVVEQRNKVDFSWSLAGIGPDYPMYYVSCEEAMYFCKILSYQTGRNFRLPTEAEWEYAARGGNKSSKTRYSGSNNVDDVAWYGANSGRVSHPVGTRSANALGIYDMSGNVWEWCSDWYRSKYDSNDTNNPKGPSTDSNIVGRGGSWSSGVTYCRVSYRNFSTSSDRSYNLGFRIVMEP